MEEITKTVVKVTSKVPTGMTEPLTAMLDDDTKVFIKRNNHTAFGNFFLINEWIGFKLGEMLQLNQPKFGIAMMGVNLDASLLESKYFPGDCTYCSYTEAITLAQTYNSQEISHLLSVMDEEEIKLFIEVVFYDAIIYNGDRDNGQNILIDSNLRTFAFDYTHAFYSPFDWNRKSTFASIYDNDDPDENFASLDGIFDENSGIYEALAEIPNSYLLVDDIYTKFDKLFTLQLIDDVFTSIPDELFEFGIDRCDLKYLQHFIETRFYQLALIREKLYTLMGGERR